MTKRKVDEVKFMDPDYDPTLVGGTSADGYAYIGQIVWDGRPHYNDGHRKCCGMRDNRPEDEPTQVVVNNVDLSQQQLRDQIQLVFDHLKKMIADMQEATEEQWYAGRIDGAMDLLQMLVDRL